MPDDPQATPGETPAEEPQVESFEAWIAEQPENVQTLVASHTSGLKSALDTERQQRKDFAKQLRDASAKAEAGSEAQKALTDMTTRAEQAERRIVFLEEAGQAEIGCTNPRAAYLVATAEDLFTRSGEPDWRRIKEAAPELFQRRTTTAHAGNGTQNPPPAMGMNEFIRRAAGRL